MQKVLALAEKGFAILSLVVFSRGVLYLIQIDGIDPAEGSVATPNSGLAKIVFSIIYLITFCLVVKDWKGILRRLIGEKSVLLLLSLAMVSIVWSEVPGRTFVRSIAMMGTTLFGFYLTDRFSHHEKLQILASAFVLIVLSSLLIVGAFPKYGLMNQAFHAGSWRGIYEHKNTLGMTMVMGIPLFIFLSAGTHRLRYVAAALFPLALILLVFSNSRSGMIFSTVNLTVIAFFWAQQRQYRRMVVSLGAAVLVGGYLFFLIATTHFAPVAVNDPAVSAPKGGGTSTGHAANIQTKEPDASIAHIVPAPPPDRRTQENLINLMGRTQLWSIMWEMIWERPLLGYGYSAFWLGEEGPSARVWRIINRWNPPHGHNGLLDLWLQLGLLGLLVFSVGYVSVLIKTIRSLQGADLADRFFTLVILLCMIQVNLTESVLMKHNSIFWVFYVAIVFAGKRKATARSVSINHA